MSDEPEQSTEPAPGAEESTPDTPGYEIPQQERQPVRTAFLVYVLPDGHAIASTGFQEDEGVDPVEALSRVLDKIIVTDGEADVYTLARACEEVVRDTERGIVVNTLLNAQLQLGRQVTLAAQEEAQRQKLMEMIQSKDLHGHR